MLVLGVRRCREKVPRTDADWAQEFAKYRQSPEFQRLNSTMTVEVPSLVPSLVPSPVHSLVPSLVYSLVPSSCALPRALFCALCCALSCALSTASPDSPRILSCDPSAAALHFHFRPLRRPVPAHS